MTRDQLEAAIWRNAPKLASPALTTRARAMRNILTAADEYAVAEYGITADRRRDLEAAIAGFDYYEEPEMHWQVMNPAGPACGLNGAVVTVDRSKVTCDRCQRTTAFKAAA